MMAYLCLTVRFLQPYYHGRGDGAEPEWPPSPLRLFQALVAGAARRSWDAQFREPAVSALQWLEQLPSYAIVAGSARQASSKYRLYVPDNVADKVAKSWSSGRDASIADYRTEKDVCPMCLGSDAVHYLYALADGHSPHIAVLTLVARSITHLGWGVDMVVANASVVSEHEAAALTGERWHPVADMGAAPLRAPIEGTLAALSARHRAFLARVSRDARGNESLMPVSPLSAFRVVGYRRPTDAITRPLAFFELRNNDGRFFAYPQDKLIHIAGMVRHLAIELMKKSPPDRVGDDWIRTYVAGHAQPGRTDHRQFSYLPLPSIGHAHTDPAVRRVMIAAPIGDDRLLQHLAMRLAGQQLQPTRRTKIAHPPTLVRIRDDNVIRCYTAAATNWASVTPVILPGHDDHKPEKTRKLIVSALEQSGVDQPCEFEWSPFSHFPKSLSAHKYGRDKRPTGYIRPGHLLTQTAVHLKIRFTEGKFPGPLVIGAGRHCGFGLMAGVDE
jgi:CRISPR-associated protein Csb2